MKTKSTRKPIFALCLLIVVYWTGLATALEVASPNGQIRLSFDVKEFEGVTGCPVYSVHYWARPIISESRLGLELESGFLGQGMEIVGQERTSSDTTWTPVYGERSTIRDRYNQIEVQLVSCPGPIRSGAD